MLTQSTRSLKRKELNRIYMYTVRRNSQKLTQNGSLAKLKELKLLCKRNPCDIEFGKIFLNCTKKALSIIHQNTDLNVTKI